MIKPMINTPEIGQSFSRAWNLLFCKENFLLLFLGNLIVGAIAAVSCGICGAAMMCGFYGVILALLHKQAPKPQFGNLFDGFKKFLPGFVAVLVLDVIFFVATIVVNLVPIIGQLAYVVICFAASAVFALSLLFVQDQDATIGEAITAPLKLLGKKEFWSFALVIFLAGLVNVLGVLACGIGILVTAPYSICVIVAAYEQAFGGPEQTIIIEQ